MLAKQGMGVSMHIESLRHRVGLRALSLIAVVWLALFFFVWIGESSFTQAEDREPVVEIQSGNCEDLSLEDAVAVVEATPEGVSDETDTLYSYRTELDISLDAFVSDPYAIVLQLNAGDLISVLGCGDVDGNARDGRLVIELRSVETGNFMGIVLLMELDQERTVLEVFASLGDSEKSSEDDAAPVDENSSVDGGTFDEDDDLDFPESDV